MSGEGPDLALYYPSLTARPLAFEEAGPAFRRFVLDHEEEIVSIGNTRYTQTNECRRCAALLPLVMMAPFARFHLVDIGTSAGLNLGIDRYQYRYDRLEWGTGPTLLLSADSRGTVPRFRDIEVLSRVGLDLDPIDPSDEDARRWLAALIWPEHAERRQRLRAALALVATLDLELIAGDALDTLPQVLARLPGEEPAVLMNSFTLIQFSVGQRRRLESIVADARSRRPLFRVSMEAIDKKEDWARLEVDDGSGLTTVGQAHPHGEWIEFF
jgi:hypothetical protein